MKVRRETANPPPDCHPARPFSIRCRGAACRARSHLARYKPFGGDGRDQYHSVVFSDHSPGSCSFGYAVTRRGVSVPASTIHTVRTMGVRPLGVGNTPSIIYFRPWSDVMLFVTGKSRAT